MRLKLAIFLSLVTASLLVQATGSSSLIQRVKEYLRVTEPNQRLMREILEGGSMGGFFTTDEVFSVFKTLASEHPNQVKESHIGSSVKEEPILAFQLSGNIKSVTSKKSQVLFTALHHSRELVTATMIVKIFVETLHGLLHSRVKNNFWDFCNIAFIPVVNVDSHKVISAAWGTKNWTSAINLRKNRNDQHCKFGKKEKSRLHRSRFEQKLRFSLRTRQPRLGPLLGNLQRPCRIFRAGNSRCQILCGIAAEHRQRNELPLVWEHLDPPVQLHALEEWLSRQFGP